MIRYNKNYEKIIAVMLAVLLFVSCLMNLTSTSVEATQSSEKFNKNYKLTGNYVDDIVEVAKAQNGMEQWQLGYSEGEAWCADFVTDCARYTGMPDSTIPYNAADRGIVWNLYQRMINNCGAEIVSSPQKGDFVFYFDGTYWSHVTLMIDGVNCIGGNQYYPTNRSHVSIMKYNQNWYPESSKPSGAYWVFVRPNYSAASHHTHNYNQYVYYWKAHPHFKCYKCSCGDVKENRNETVPLSTCSSCLSDYKAVLKTDKMIYQPGDTVNISWNKIPNATHYNLWLYKMNDDNSVSLISRNDLLTDTEFSFYNLPAGKYYTSFNTYNRNYWMQDNSDWFHSESDRVIIEVATPSNFGDEFRAEIVYNKNNEMALANINGNVEIQKRDAEDLSKVWDFKRQTDGSYVITSCYDGKVIDVSNAKDENKTNIWLYEFNGSFAQKWYIFGNPDSFIMRSGCSRTRVLDVNGANTSSGSNVSLYDSNGTAAQIFSIVTLENNRIVGDANNDGEVNIADALVISRYDAGIISMDKNRLAVSDVNRDGEVNIADALMISRLDAGIINSFDLPNT